MSKYVNAYFLNMKIVNLYWNKIFGLSYPLRIFYFYLLPDQNITDL